MIIADDDDDDEVVGENRDLDQESVAIEPHAQQATP